MLFGRPSPYFRMRVARAERMCTPSPTLAHLHAHISMKPWPPPILLTCFHISDHVPSQRNMSDESIRSGSTCAFDAVERIYHHHRSLTQVYLDEHSERKMMTLCWAQD